MSSSLVISGKRLVICTVGGVPHRSVGASVVLFYHYISKFKSMAFNIVHLHINEVNKSNIVMLNEYSRDMEEKDSFRIIVHNVDYFNKISGLKREIVFSILPNEIIQRIRNFDPELTFCFDIFAAGILGHIVACPKIVWIGDLNFQTFLYHALYSARERIRDVIKLPSVWLLCRSWKDAYKKILSDFNLVVVASKSSELALSKLGIYSKYLPYPWAVSENINAPSVKTRHSIPSYLFFGTLSALGSRSAFHYLLHSIYPKVIQLYGRGSFQIFMCGLRDLPEWVRKELTKCPEIIFLGFVEDLSALMCTCHAVIVPIDIPVGNRSRIITAMALGGLVIAHKNTSLSNPELINGVTCYLAVDSNHFVEHMRIAYEKPDLSESIIEKAREVYNKTYRPDVSTKIMAAEIVKILEMEYAKSQQDRLS